jgi:hypothetical protein
MAPKKKLEKKLRNKEKVKKAITIEVEYTRKIVGVSGKLRTL